VFNILLLNKTNFCIMHSGTILMSIYAHDIVSLYRGIHFLQVICDRSVYVSGAVCKLAQHLRARIFDTQVQHINSDRGEKMVL
jgi:hypothetical protein